MLKSSYHPNCLATVQLALQAYLRLRVNRLFTKMTTVGPKMLLLGFSEPSLGLLRSVFWATQKAPETLENVLLWLPDKSGRAAALPGPVQDVLIGLLASQSSDAGSPNWDNLGQNIPTSQLPSNPAYPVLAGETILCSAKNVRVNGLDRLPHEHAAR